MKKLFLLTCFALFWCFGATAQVVYEDFEGGVADLNWTGLNGTYNGPVMNPDPTGANTSAWVGSYTNNPSVDFSFALHTFPATLDISQFNRFKMKIWSPTFPAKALLKLEGPGGPAAEKIIDITAANQWVEYTFDLSGGALQANLKTILVSFNSFVEGDDKTYYFDDIVAEKAEVCYETFEGGAALPWVADNGVYAGAVANPQPNSVNSSATVGKYTKSNMHSYSLLSAEPGTSFDLSVYNQFKLKVYTTAPTQVLLKLQGPGGAIERTKNIAVGGAWQEYTFDFSAEAANTGLNKVIIFFDPGVEASGDDYYFDDLCAAPNPCQGATPDPYILDDFECNRNATYAGDWSALTVVNNPFINVDNPSSKVGRWEDPSGPGTGFANFNLDFQDPIDLTVRNQFSLKLYAPKAGDLLLKIEGGPSSYEQHFPVTELNKWVEYTVDFSAQAGGGHRKIVVFINANVDGAPGDIYYVDDLKLSPKPVAPPLEDFEGPNLHLGWQPLDGNEPVHGTFAWPSTNSAPNGVNDSPQTGCYTKGSSGFSTLQAISLTALDLSVYPQFNLDVLSPAGGGTVLMQLNSLIQGNKEAEATITTPGEWETLSFDFSSFDNILDFFEVRLIFNPGTAAAGETWCIDNLRQGQTTVDPCADVVPVPNIVDDFECQRNFTEIFYGTDDIVPVNNPHLAPENGSLKVGEYTDPAGAGTGYEGIGYRFAAPPDLSLYNHLSVQIWSPADNVPILFKLQNGDNVERRDTLPTGNTWYKFDIDFSAAEGTAATELVIFINENSPTGGGIYYIDNIRWARAGYNGCVADNQTAGLIDNWTYFANGHLEDEAYLFKIVDNPLPAGINTSAKVGEFVKASDGEPFAGMYATPNLESPIDWKGVKTVRAKVLMDHIGNFAVKIEGSLTGADGIEIPVANTKINEWEELTFNFSAAPDNGEFTRLTIFFDLNIDATGSDVTSYFDDIVIGNGQCTTVNVFDPGPVAAMSVAPNPTSSRLLVQNVRGVSRMEVINVFGQRIASLQTSGDLQTDIDASRFPAGVYTLTGYNSQGLLVGNAKFVKQ